MCCREAGCDLVGDATAANARHARTRAVHAMYPKAAFEYLAQISDKLPCLALPLGEALRRSTERALSALNLTKSLLVYPLVESEADLP